jgi:hypothetical protein
MQRGCNEGCSSYPSLAIHQPFYTVKSLPSFRLHPNAHPNSLCLWAAEKHLLQHACCSQVALCIIASLHLHCCHEQRHTYQNRSITQVLGSSSSEICPLNLVDVAAACVAAAQQVTSMGRQHRYSINPSRLIAD